MMNTYGSAGISKGVVILFVGMLIGVACVHYYPDKVRAVLDFIVQLVR